MQKNIILIVIFSFMFVGCAWKYNVPVQRPAEVNLVGYKKVAVMNVDGQKGKDIANVLTEHLFQTNRFEVIERSRIDAIIREQTEAMSDLYSAEGASKIGRLIQADALIFGDSKHDFNELLDEDSYKDSEGRYHTKYTRTGRANITSSLKVIDVATAKILATKVVPAESRASLSETDKVPHHIDPEPLYDSCVKSVVTEFMKQIAPYTENVEVTIAKFDPGTNIFFFSKGKYNSDINRACEFVEKGYWDKAKPLFLDMKEKALQDPEVKHVPEEVAKTYYNYGLALQYTGEFDEGIRHLQLAFESVPSEDIYSLQLERCKEDKRKAAELKKQLETGL